MTITANWSPLEPDLKTVFAHEQDPLQALAEGHIPAIVLRRAYNPGHCAGLIQRFIERGLMGDSQAANSESEDTFQFATRTRIDIGTSLVNRARGGQAVSDDDARNKEDFLEHSAGTHELFSHLFDGFDNPVDTLYDALSALAVGKEVKVAREPDGRLYGPAIFRIHYAGHVYTPHINHVGIGDKLFNYAVSRFTHQFAGLICFQNSTQEGKGTHAVVHRCAWTPEIQSHLSHGTFHEYTAESEIQQHGIEVEPGDFYLFNSGYIHQVAAVEGTTPRIVLATFIGYSADDDEIFVWA
ncbi:MAG: hypothetical protein O7E52_20680 [Candidatus Poribacteria bacterium]|nr:hypothetical protein [Candidatus Poribacteria bacterium]